MLLYVNNNWGNHINLILLCCLWLIFSTLLLAVAVWKYWIWGKKISFLLEEDIRFAQLIVSVTNIMLIAYSTITTISMDPVRISPLMSSRMSRHKCHIQPSSHCSLLCSPATISYVLIKRKWKLTVLLMSYFLKIGGNTVVLAQAHQP